MYENVKIEKDSEVHIPIGTNEAIFSTMSNGQRCIFEERVSWRRNRETFDLDRMH